MISLNRAGMVLTRYRADNNIIHLKYPFMKKLLVGLLFLSTASISASAASKMKKTNGVRIDHSKDHAYSANWADEAQSPAPGTTFQLGTSSAYHPYMQGKTMYYGLSNFTLHGATAANMRGPYLGQDAPSYDGAAKNAYRNMRANNESERLPDNNGTIRK
jgi:hypothetical protein